MTKSRRYNENNLGFLCCRSLLLSCFSPTLSCWIMKSSMKRVERVGVSQFLMAPIYLISGTLI